MHQRYKTIEKWFEKEDNVTNDIALVANEAEGFTRLVERIIREKIKLVRFKHRAQKRTAKQKGPQTLIDKNP